MNWNSNNWMLPKDTRSTKERAKARAKEALKQISQGPNREETWEEDQFSELVLDHSNE